MDPARQPASIPAAAPAPLTPAAAAHPRPCACLQFQTVDGGLKDTHPYVREAAVMGVLKCYHQVG